MLNELLLARRGLDRCALGNACFHRWVKEPGRQAGFIVGLDQNGCPATIEYCDQDRMARLWTIGRHGNHGTFPVLNKMPKPIWSVPDEDEIRKRLSEIQKQGKQPWVHCLREACEKREQTCAKKERDWWSRLRREAGELLPLFRNQGEDVAALATLAERFLHHDNREVGAFLTRLSELVIAAALNDQIPDMDLVERTLIGKWDKRKREFRAEVPLVLDVADYSQFTCRVAGPQIREAVIACLNKASDGNLPSGVCALTGAAMPLETDKFPSPKLPVIGQVYLHSMNENVPCQNRYGLAGPSSIPVGRATATNLAKALKFLTEEDRKGKTWMAIPSHKEGKDLLIVYLEDKPDSAIKTAMLFAEPEAEASIVEGAYEAAASNVCQALEADQNIPPNSLLRLFVLTKVDPGRVQVAMSTAYTVANVIRGNSNWQAGAKNGPRVVCKMFGKKGERAYDVVPHCPAPAEVMRVLQCQWINGGTDQRSAPGCRLQEVYEVFLGEIAQAARRASLLLALSLRRSTPLLIGVGGALRSGDWGPFKGKNRERAQRDCLAHVSLVSILLHKLGKQKETYMQESAFNVGRLLALADTLHKEYCVHVRNKGKSQRLPQLLGNALMPVALENPARGLARLSERLPVYQAWANTVQGEGVGLAKWTLGQLGRVSSKLSCQEVPERLDDQMKAQLLLGYLARSEGESSSEPESTDIEKGKEVSNVD